MAAAGPDASVSSAGTEAETAGLVASARPPQAQVEKEKEEEERSCRFCFEGEEEGELVSPCSCSGGQKWVHLTCLRRWQRGVLASLPTLPHLCSSEDRQRVCGICKSPFTVPPPTQLQLLESFIGPGVAELLSEGCLIGAHREFSACLARQEGVLPGVLPERLGHRHWREGLFLVVRVTKPGSELVRLRISNESDLQAFAERVESNWSFNMHGRRMRIAREGPLAEVPWSEEAEVADIRRAIASLEAPLLLTLHRTSPPDESEDGILAVNLTRRKLLHHREDQYKLVTWTAAVHAFLERTEDQALCAEAEHFSGGPCDEDEVACCIVDGGPLDAEPYTVCHSLLAGLRLAHARGKALELEGPDGADGQSPLSAPVERPPSPACQAQAAKRRRFDVLDEADDPRSPVAGVSGTASAMPPQRLRGQPEGASPSCATTAPQQPAANRGPVRLRVYWGSAGWSRRQLLGEVARGSWGLCRSTPEDVLAANPRDAWAAAYPRLVFAAHSELSEDYSQMLTGNDEGGSRLATLRPLLGRQQMSLHHRMLLLREMARSRLAQAGGDVQGAETLSTSSFSREASETEADDADGHDAREDLATGDDGAGGGGDSDNDSSSDLRSPDAALDASELLRH